MGGIVTGQISIGMGQRQLGIKFAVLSDVRSGCAPCKGGARQ